MVEGQGFAFKEQVRADLPLAAAPGSLAEGAHVATIS